MIYRNIFLLLLPLFFVFHGYVVNYDAVPAGEAVLLTLLYIVTAVSIAAIAWLFFRDVTKAAFFASLAMALHFFYGSIQDYLKENFADSFLLRYRFIFPFIIIFFLAVILLLKKRKSPIKKLPLFLNTWLVILLLIDIVRLSVAGYDDEKDSRYALMKGLTVCDTCSKPDVYFILPDQYTGNEALQGIFSFDNSRFTDSLKRIGFHVAAKSNSNYNLTPFSVASTLNMEYLYLIEGPQDFGAVADSYTMIRDNHVMNYFRQTGYQFYNCSIFDFDGQPANEYGAFLPYGINLITAQTFISRLKDDFHSDILAGKFGKGLQKKYAYEYMHFNDDILQLTRSIASQKTTTPKFVYTHLMMPHYPYYFDSSGHALPLEKLAGLRKANPKDYTGYLQYTNNKLLDLIHHILSHSPKPPVIVLLGDHGFRHPDMKTDARYDFMNLNAVYIPGGNYSGFYDSITNVNQFRVLFNNCFHQQLPLLKDSTIDVWPD